MAANPIFPLYFNDMDRSTKTWTDSEYGTFMRLLVHQWAQGWLPTDPDRLARITPGAAKHWDVIGPKFKEVQPGKLQNERLEQIREERRAFSELQSERGKKGGRPRKENPDETRNKPGINPDETRMKAETKPGKKPSSSFSFSNSFYSSLSGSNSEIPTEWSDVWKIMAHLLQKMGDAFSEKKSEDTDSPFSWHGKEMRALKGIVDKIKAKYKGLGKDEPGPDEIVDWWIKFLKCRQTHWPNWLKDKWELTLLNSKFEEIYLAIKNGNTTTTTGNRNGGPNFTAAGLNAEIEKRYPTSPANAEPPN